MAKLRWSLEAVEEMERLSPLWARTVYKTAELIADAPFIGRTREELDGKRTLPAGRHFILIYDVLEEGQIVYIAGIQDSRRGDRRV